MARYFKYNEFIHSNTAKSKNIDNTPSAKEQENIEELMEILDIFREEYGKPITISSGYRCEKLNKAVGGKDTSAHKVGYAADLVTSDVQDLMNSMTNTIKKHNIKFDQLIFEKSKNSTWVHFGLKNQQGELRGKIFQLAV